MERIWSLGVRLRTLWFLADSSAEKRERSIMAYRGLAADSFALFLVICLLNGLCEKKGNACMDRLLYALKYTTPAPAQGHMDAARRHGHGRPYPLRLVVCAKRSMQPIFPSPHDGLAACVHSDRPLPVFFFLSLTS